MFPTQLGSRITFRFRLESLMSIITLILWLNKIPPHHKSTAITGLRSLLRLFLHVFLWKVYFFPFIVFFFFFILHILIFRRIFFLFYDFIINWIMQTIQYWNLKQINSFEFETPKGRAKKFISFKEHYLIIDHVVNFVFLTEFQIEFTRFN